MRQRRLDSGPENGKDEVRELGDAGPDEDETGHEAGQRDPVEQTERGERIEAAHADGIDQTRGNREQGQGRIDAPDANPGQRR